ncbi:MAG: hypothetical protein GX637_07045 [Clostridiales bacterium]|nr:hypothetical protein [Clostridiales bacterium]
MKKLISLLLACLLLCGAALAETAGDAFEGDPLAEENAFLTQEELEMYLAVLAGDALAFGVNEAVTDPETGETTVTYLTDALLTIADEELSENSAVLGAVLSGGQEDLRGICLGDPMQDVLDVYPSDNPGLEGSYYDAALYVNDERPQATAGYLLREGQRVTEITHLVFTWQEEGVVRCGITYTIEQDRVTGIEIFGLGSIIEEAAALEELSNVAQIQENREFAPYPVSLLGDDIAPFEESDLVFGGLDFLHLTNEDAVALLGEAPVDDWLEDSTGEWLRTRQWDDLSIVFVYDSQRNFLQVDSLTFLQPGFEGPRGVRVDDPMDSVMNRFLHSDQTPTSAGILLYGDGENAPYAVLSYADTTATLTYTLRTGEGRMVLWNMTFADGMLQSGQLLLR